MAGINRLFNLASAIAIVRLCVIEREKITLHAVLVEVARLLLQTTIVAFLFHFVGCLGLLAWLACTLLFQVLAVISALDGEYHQVNDWIRVDIKRSLLAFAPENDKFQ